MQVPSIVERIAALSSVLAREAFNSCNEVESEVLQAMLARECRWYLEGHQQGKNMSEGV